jgi:hypothetical protein
VVQPLFARYPALIARLPHRPLGCFPTPVERVGGVDVGSARLWVKREDQSGEL